MRLGDKLEESYITAGNSFGKFESFVLKTWTREESLKAADLMKAIIGDAKFASVFNNKEKLLKYKVLFNIL